MKATPFYLVLILLFFAIESNAQIDTITVKTVPKKGLLKQAILPIGLLTASVLISNSTFEKSLQKDIRNSVGNDFSTNIDDFTGSIPIIQLYAADILGVKSKNHWFDQSKNLGLAILATNVITVTLKKNIHKIRPNGDTDAESFPSGHTSNAFTIATVLYEEFKDTSPILAYSGFAFATATGTMRMMNNKHYLSDVLAGAGIGIFVTEVIYSFDPIIKWNPFRKTTNVTLLPQLGDNQKGVYLCIRF
ncbi:phosphatase PAP2 family protein [Flavobacterium paronense]|uniref:Phosphatase PAP2 family protein n=1 Tax=Flavobacterium paronense TaxID=1392775 RepID=A0ABV5GCQ4_9FLAO|nr:phosphatase PAP2 family protein [Flavobacterium paronense]MDN3676271.1 phosphatase PAP2 family protein [Flavobacterium paronense]